MRQSTRSPIAPTQATHGQLARLMLLMVATSILHAADSSLTRSLKTLPANARLALCGDSITEQMRYTAYVEAYLLACAGRTDVSVFQFGWGGENADQFRNRIMRGDLDAFKPTAISIAYGANDCGGQAWQDWMESMWRGRLTSVLATLAERYLATTAATVVCSPTWFQSDASGSNRAHIDGADQTLARFRVMAAEIARQRGLAFADLQQRLKSSGEAALAAIGPAYRYAGQDGVHPGPNGHLVLASEVLRALGCNGALATITVSASGTVALTAGHTLVSNSDGRLTISSTRYPFCIAYDRSTAPDAMATILPFLPFMQELNRFRLVVERLDAPSADITWGEETHRFTREQLAVGINLPEHFRQTPFDGAFATLMKAIITQQEHERTMIKAAGDATAPKAGWTAADVAARDALDAVSHAAVVPITHTIVIAPAR